MFLSLRRFHFALAASAGLFAATAAEAELGGPAASVSVDSVRMNTRITTMTVGSYTRHDLTRVNDGMVHEFANASGQVFAVTWSGPGKPDLRTLLGPYFATLQASNATNGAALHALRRPPQVAQVDLQIQTGGHMGWFHGVAFVPSLAPPDFSPADLMPAP